MIIEELYDALIEAGATKEKASAAARAVAAVLVTREHLDLRVAELNAHVNERIAQLEARLTNRMIGIALAQIAVIAALVKLL